MIRVPQTQPEVTELALLHKSRVQNIREPSPILSAFSSRVGSPSPQRQAGIEQAAPPQEPLVPPETTTANVNPSRRLWLFCIGFAIIGSIISLLMVRGDQLGAEVLAPASSTPVRTRPTPVKPSLVNWARPELGIQILPSSQLGDRTYFFLEKWLKPSPELYHLLDPSDPPQLCMSAPPGSRLVLDLPKVVDLRKIVVKTMYGPVFTSVRAWTGTQLDLVPYVQENDAYALETKTSVLELQFHGTGCVWGVEIWGN